MYFTDRGLEELTTRRGQEQVTLAWLAERLREFVLQYLYVRGAGVAGGSGVAYGAHVIGFVVGALAVLPLRGSGQHRELQPRFGPYTRR